ncbi:hypothetical protein LguiA_028678 [Lonicera macranthoides]
MSLLQLPLSQFKTLTLSTPFLHGSYPTTHLTKPSSSSPQNPSFNFLPTIRSMKILQGKVVCATNDKTVSVEVVRLAPHPKYKRRIRLKKKYQAHDPDNRFKVGDIVQLEKSRPISKTKAFLAIPAPERNTRKPKDNDNEVAISQDLGLPLESQQA